MHSSKRISLGFSFFGGLLVGIAVLGFVRVRVRQLLDILFFLVFGNSCAGVFGENRVQKHGNDGSHTVTRRQKDGDTVSETLLAVAAVGATPKVGRVGRSTQVLEGKRPDSDTDTNGQRQGHDELDTTGVQVERRRKRDTRHQDIGKEKDGHATKDTVGNAGNDTRDLAKDSHEDQPDTTGVTGTTTGALGQRNDTIVLRKGRVGHGREKRRKHGAQRIRCKTSLQGFVEFDRINVEFGHFKDSRNVAHSFDRGDEVGNKEREDGGTIKAKGETFDPEESDGLGFLDLAANHVVGAILVAKTRDQVPKEESNNNVAVPVDKRSTMSNALDTTTNYCGQQSVLRHLLHENRSKEFNQDEHDHDGETQTNEFCLAVSHFDLTILAKEARVAKIRHGIQTCNS